MGPRYSFCAISVLLLFIGLGGSDRLYAQNIPALEAYRIESPISVDGTIDEPAWKEAAVVTEFRQYRPNEGNPASQETHVHILYGPENVYVGAVLFDDQPDQIQQTLGSRDEYNRADWFTVSIDSYLNQKFAYTFAVNAANVQLDAIRTGSGRRGRDESWDAIWESSTRVTSEGWIAEIRIPYNMLRFSSDQKTWGIHFSRRIPRSGERTEWPLVPRTERENMIANYGRLEGLTEIEPRRNLQIRPYTVSRFEMQERSGRPGELTTNQNLDTGGDVKVGLSSNITLDATINPDFGQVESDPAVLNLTAFETFYRERRPFFLEGAEIYEFSLGRRSEMLYTRRIGAEAPIIGASKLSGRTEGGLSFGLLGATTGDSFDPTRSYGAARFSQQIGSYSSAGGILTGYEGPSPEGSHRSIAGGADWDLRFLNNAYGVSGFAAVTRRPSASGDDTDETGVSANLAAERRRGIWTYDVEAEIFDDQFDPNDVGRLRRSNYISLGSSIRHDINGGGAFGPFQQADWRLYLDQEWSYRTRIDQGLRLLFRSDWTTRSFQRIELNATSDYVFGGYDIYETRGLGPRTRPFELELETETRSDERRDWELEPTFGITFFGDGGRSYATGFRGNWDLSSRVSMRGSLTFEWEDEMIAWTSNETFAHQNDSWTIGVESAPPSALDPTDYQSFNHTDYLTDLLSDVSPYSDTGHYYLPIYGARDTRSLDFTVRGNLTFTPDLSLQLYSQLFVAKGRYRDFKILKDRDTLVPFADYPKRDAFALNSFQVNAVLRWEYLPGSTIYLVWTQGRSADNRMNPLAPRESSPYSRSMDKQIGDTFSIFPNNVFLLKLDYTFLR